MSLKVVVSAYACRPDAGSEPGIGWNLARELVKHHKIWVITRENNRSAIEAELDKHPIPGLQVVYCDLPRWFQKVNRGQRLVQIHYYLWQIRAYFVVQKLHREVNFNLIHHVTYVKYWSPSFLSLLPLPFIWGPVGGGEVTPKGFSQDFGLRGKVYELLRDLARSIGELDPFVRLTAQRSVLAQATTEDTAERLRQLGATHVRVLSQLGLSREEIDQLAQQALHSNSKVRFISIGRLLHWKGFHLGLRAFAQADLPEDSEYWLLGDGPERSRLQSLTEELGIIHRVKFLGNLPRTEVLQKLGEGLALIHPSLHESGGLVCLEAMAAGLPVICLDTGGPALQVTPETGFKIPAHTPEQTVQHMAVAITRLAQDAELRSRLGQASQARVNQVYNWESKGQFFAQLYREVFEQYQSASTAIQSTASELDEHSLVGRPHREGGES